MKSETRRRSSRESGTTQRQAAKVIEEARKLARSGRYPDWTSILDQLATMEGYDHARRRFDNAAFRAQLNQLCTMAQRPGRALIRNAELGTHM